MSILDSQELPIKPCCTYNTQDYWVSSDKIMNGRYTEGVSILLVLMESTHSTRSLRIHWIGIF